VCLHKIYHSASSTLHWPRRTDPPIGKSLPPHSPVADTQATDYTRIYHLPTFTPGDTHVSTHLFPLYTLGQPTVFSTYHSFFPRRIFQQPKWSTAPQRPPPIYTAVRRTRVAPSLRPRPHWKLTCLTLNFRLLFRFFTHTPTLTHTHLSLYVHYNILTCTHTRLTPATLHITP
jgi:hypothetical protein